jgi:hypothetical protein
MSLIKIIGALLAYLGGGALIKHAKRRVRRGKHYSNDEF